MSDVSSPKKRPQRPAAPLWAARRRLRTESPDARPPVGSGDRASSPPAEPAPSTLVAPPQVPRPAMASSASPSDVREIAPAPGPATSPPVAQTKVVPRPPAPAVPASPGVLRPVLNSTSAKALHKALGPSMTPTPLAGAVVPVTASNESDHQAEAVSLREIESLVSPGKLPHRLPSTSARSVAGGPGAPPLAKAIPFSPAVSPGRAALSSVPDDSDAAARASRWGETHATHARPTLATAPAPRPAAPNNVHRAPQHDATFSASEVERPLPNPLESSVADLELMAALAPVPSKRPIEQKPVWAPPKAPAQAKASTFAVLSSEAVAALKGTRSTPGSVVPPPPTAVGSIGQGGAPRPLGAVSPLATRNPTVRSTAVQTERPPAAGKGAVFVPPPPPLRVNAPSIPGRTSDPVVDDSAWDSLDDSPNERAAAPPEPVQPFAVSSPQAGPSNMDVRAMDALQMRAGLRGSLPDHAELLRDGPERVSARGSVVDPLELYGATPPKKSGPPEQSLPKVMVQVPAKQSREATAGTWTQSTVTGEVPAARVSVAVPAKQGKTIDREGAETLAESAAAEAKAVFRPKVELPSRVEPKPFPKAPPRKVAEAKQKVAPVPIIKPLPVPQKPASVADAKPAPLDTTHLEDDEIQVDITPEPSDPEPTASASTAAGPQTPDSGRFDLQQLMSGRPSSKTSTKGLGDADLFELAGDLFSDASSPKIAPPDLGSLGRAASDAPNSARLLAPVALGSAPDRASASASSLRPADVQGAASPSRARALAPWIALPVVALCVAAVMVLLGRGNDPKAELPTPTASVRAGDPNVGTTPSPSLPPATSPDGPPSNGEASASPTASSKSLNDAPQGPATAWKPPSNATSPSTQVTTAGASTSAPPTATTSTPPAPPAPTATAAASSGNEFNASAAKAALRAAAGSAAGCPADKPGVANVSITFAPSGRVTSSQVSGAFAGTTTGGCIASAMRGATVPPFEGGPVSVVWKVTLR